MTFTLGGYCPACGEEMLGSDEYSTVRSIVCQNGSCPDPDLLSRLLAKPDQHVHLIDFREDGYTVQHPLAERAKPESLFACDLTDEFRALTEPPGVGMFRVPPGGTLADAEEVDRDEVLFEVPTAPESPEVQAGPGTGTDLRELLPIGTLHAIPATTALPEGFMEVTSTEVRLPRADYPELGAVIEAAGFDSVMIDDVEHVAVDLPPQATEPPEGVRYVLRVQ